MQLFRNLSLFCIACVCVSECPSTYTGASELCQRLTEVEDILKTESESDEEVDIISAIEPSKVKIKKEQEEVDEEVNFYMGTVPALEYARDTAQQVVYQKTDSQPMLLCVFGSIIP